MKKIILFLCMVTLGVSCTKDAFVYDDIESIVYFLNSGKVSMKVTAKSYDAVVIKGGNTNDATEVTVAIDESLIPEYNSANGTFYQLMPEAAYSFDSSNMKVNNSTKMVKYPITLDMTNLNSGSWMIPLRLTSNTTKVNEKKDKLMLVIEIK